MPTAEQAAVLAGMGSAGTSLDGTVGYATVVFEGQVQDVPIEDARAVLDAVEAINGIDGLTVGVSGQALEMAGAEPPSSEVIGVTVALVILLFAFGSLVGAFLPVGLALLSLGVGQGLVLLIAQLLERGDVRPDPGRDDRPGRGHRLRAVRHEPLQAGARRRPGAARGRALEAVRTAGRSVRLRRGDRDRSRSAACS